jgi:hypothetical protein
MVNFCKSNVLRLFGLMMTVISLPSAAIIINDRKLQMVLLQKVLLYPDETGQMYYFVVILVFNKGCYY